MPNYQFCFSTSEGAVEGLTNSSGEFQIETINNDDFVTIFANKKGYFVGQRTYVRDSKNEVEINANQSKNKSKEDEPKKITVVLIRESLILEEKSIIMLTYSNLPRDNFSPIILKAESSKV